MLRFFAKMLMLNEIIFSDAGFYSQFLHCGETNFGDSAANCLEPGCSIIS